MKYIKLVFTYLRCLVLLSRALKLRKTSLFSARYYLDRYSDIEDMFLLPELHYLEHGMYERRNPHPLFETAYYLDQVPDFFCLKTDPVSHFLAKGISLGINPHPFFNVDFYLAQRAPDRLDNPVEHYMDNYRRNTVEPNPLFFTGEYTEKMDLTDCEGPPLLHYIHNRSEKILPFTADSLEEVNLQQRFQCYLERFSTFQGVLFISGWGFAPEKSIDRIGYLSLQGAIIYLPWQGLPSQDIVERFGSDANNCRFDLKLAQDLPENHMEVVLVFQFADGTVAYEYNLARYGLQERPHTYFLRDIFSKMLQDDPTPARVLEIGSRDRSGFVSKDHFVPEWMEYTGTDIMQGDNVDVACDAHEISRFFPDQSFDYIFSLNVFEHLLVPWKVVLEVNKLLKVGGKVMIFTHQTMPLHDTPCDYWRFSDKAWQALLNKDTGFKITYAGMGDSVDIVARKAHPGSYNLSLAPAYLHSMVIAEKTGTPKVDWKINIRGCEDRYPVANHQDD